jgi:uncharacterized integral membrane protein (TIGR00698 family)
MLFSVANRSHTLNGIIFIVLFALSSFYLAQTSWISASGISPLVLAIVLGILYGNTLHHAFPTQWEHGIHFSAKRLLRLAIILYGFRVNLQQIHSVGIQSLLLDFLVVTSTLAIGYWVGVKILKLDRKLALLISTGSAICGAAAVLAAEEVIKSESYQASIAVGTVVLFGTLGMFLYPLLFHFGIFNFTDNQFGIFVGASVHEVAQALAAGANISNAAGNTAVIVKMSRVILLVPALITLSACEAKARSHQISGKKRIVIPWFAVGFIAVIGFNSLDLLSPTLITYINQIDMFLLTMSMAAIGIETNLAKIKHVGLKPLYLASFLFIWLTITAYLFIKLVPGM